MTGSRLRQGFGGQERVHSAAAALAKAAGPAMTNKTKSKGRWCYSPATIGVERAMSGETAGSFSTALRRSRAAAAFFCLFHMEA